MCTSSELLSDRKFLRRLFAKWEECPKKAEHKIISVCDEEKDHYLLLTIGWNGYQREHDVFVHVDLHDGLFWIEADQTPDGFALDLEAEGVPKNRIVLAFKHPEQQRFYEYAQAV
ncbi:MAG: element excision factor XisI family protein [Armatimonas sp.]